MCLSNGCRAILYLCSPLRNRFRCCVLSFLVLRLCVWVCAFTPSPLSLRTQARAHTHARAHTPSQPFPLSPPVPQLSPPVKSGNLGYENPFQASRGSPLPGRCAHTLAHTFAAAFLFSRASRFALRVSGAVAGAELTAVCGFGGAVINFVGNLTVRVGVGAGAGVCGWQVCVVSVCAVELARSVSNLRIPIANQRA